MANELKYRRYTIRSMKSGEGWGARAFRGKAKASDILSGASEEDAILAVKAVIDGADITHRAQRVDGYPTATEVFQALQSITMAKNQRLMLEAHYAATDRTMTATELANAGGYDSYVSANSHYGKLGRSLAEEMEWQPPEFDGKPTWTFALATGADGFTRADIDELGLAEWRWKLRPEVAEAWELYSGQKHI